MFKGGISIVLVVVMIGGLCPGMLIGSMSTTFLQQRWLQSSCNVTGPLNTTLNTALFGIALPTGAAVGCNVVGALTRSRAWASKGDPALLALLMCSALLTTTFSLVTTFSATSAIPFIVSKYLTGFASVGVSLIVPNLADRFAPTPAKRVVWGSWFAISTNVGIFFSALMTFVAERTTSDSASCSSVEVRIIFLSALVPLVHFALLVAVFAARRGIVAGRITASDTIVATTTTKTTWMDDESTAILNTTAVEVNSDTLPEKPFSLGKAIATGIFLSAAGQLTGINAIFFYTPLVASSLDLDPDAGNVVLMGVSLLSSIAGFQFSRRVGFRTCMLTGVSIVALADACLCLGTHPDVLPQKASDVVAGIGSVVFLISFQAGLAVAYYPLTTRVFKNTNYRLSGAGFIVLFEMIFCITTALVFPVAMGAMSLRRLGESVVFGAFAGIGAVAWFVLRWGLPLG
jgi:hypothetical protein